MKKRVLHQAFLGICMLLGVCINATVWSATKDAQGLQAPAPVQTVAVGDVVLGYRSFGQGKPLLLITGYGCTMDAWDPVLLSILASQHRVLVFDNRGMGFSTTSATPFSLRLFADDAVGLLTALGIARADVLGWSMGAITALEMAAAYPERVGKIVAYGAAADPGPVNAAIDRFNRMTPAAFVSQLFPRDWAEAHPGAASRLPKPARAPDPESVRRQREALAAWPGFGDRLSGLGKDVLLVVGRDDAVTPPEQSLKLAGLISGAWLAQFPDAGHWLMYQMPDALAGLVEIFLDVASTPLRHTEVFGLPDPERGKGRVAPEP